jgi:hypothetical protein
MKAPRGLIPEEQASQAAFFSTASGSIITMSGYSKTFSITGF